MGCNQRIKRTKTFKLKEFLAHFRKYIFKATIIPEKGVSIWIQPLETSIETTRL